VLRLHDTAVGRITEVVPREAGRLSLYVCGPTVYDVPHLGHGRAVLVYDVLRRYLEWSGVQVRHVSNVTDIDDKIIAKAAEDGRSIQEVAAQYEAVWWEATDALGVLRPTESPRATEYLEEMVTLVQDLVERGAAYQTDDGVYLAVEAVEGYGLLAGQPLSELRAGERVEVAGNKRCAGDFALWKSAKQGEASWASPWGPGRPGWHTECVAMSLDLLGEDFDLHAGGLDLKFPHHENERAQAVALGRRFARHWMHHAFVEMAGQKMSKSLGNFTSLTDLLARHDGRAYRLLTLQSHYRSPMEVTPRTMAQAEEALARLDSLSRRFDLVGAGPAAATVGVGGGLDAGDAQFRAAFQAAMECDLDTPAALRVIFDLTRRANAAADAGNSEMGRRLGVVAVQLAGAMGLDLGQAGTDIDPASADLVDRRDEARGRGDYAAADALRAELADRGWLVEDGPHGTRLARRRQP